MNTSLQVTKNNGYSKHLIIKLKLGLYKHDTPNTTQWKAQNKRSPNMDHVHIPQPVNSNYNQLVSTYTDTQRV